MRVLIQPGFVLTFALIAVVGWTISAGSVHADAQTVKIVDNDAPPVTQGIDARQSQWGYGPTQIVVTKGDMVTFQNPAEGKRPHTVTSVSLAGTSFDNGMAAGAKFDSSPSRDTLVTPGNSWTLDTSTLDPGNYAYFCRIHPWMLGEITVLPQS